MFDLRVLCLDLFELDGDFMIGLLIDAQKDLTEGTTSELGLEFILPVHNLWMRRVRLRRICCAHYCNIKLLNH